jgi:hypothetical protein
VAIEAEKRAKVEEKKKAIKRRLANKQQQINI